MSWYFFKASAFLHSCKWTLVFATNWNILWGFFSFTYFVELFFRICEYIFQPKMRLNLFLIHEIRAAFEAYSIRPLLKSFSPCITQRQMTALIFLPLTNYCPHFFLTITKFAGKWDCYICHILKFDFKGLKVNLKVR